MKLIQIILAFLFRKHVAAVDYYSDPNHLLKYFGWARDITKKVSPNEDDAIETLVILIPAIIIIGLIQLLLRDVFYHIPTFIFGAAVLIYCLGSRSFDNMIEPFIESWEQGDYDAAAYNALAFENPEAHDKTDTTTLPEKVVKTLIIGSNEKVFAILFWFMALGPVGAFAYRACIILRDYNNHDCATSNHCNLLVDKLVFIIDWIPSRLTAITFAMAGSFVESFEAWLHIPHASINSNHNILLAAGLGALKMDISVEKQEYGVEEVKDARDLVTRTTVVWLAVIAILTLTNLVS
ncbi:MAG: regulatory signaling modulator protein AmpE [Gammaproteobacteria bacterium]|nr:MAG: regulatory signaling modulator protein AmpE [Gammaproteobacteria bacterium]